MKALGGKWIPALLVTLLCLAFDVRAAIIEPAGMWPGFPAYQPLDTHPTGQAVYVLSWSTFTVVERREGGSRVTQVLNLGMGRCDRFYEWGSSRLLVTGWEGLVLLDIADPLHPVILGSYRPGHQARFLGRIGNLFYLNDLSTQSIEIIDWAESSSPRRVGKLEGNLLGTIRGDLAFGTTSSGEFQVWQLTEQTNRTVLGTLAGPISARRVYAAEGRAYVLPGTLAEGIHVIDVANPAAPKALGRIVTGGDIYDLALEGDIGWIPAGNRGLLKANLRDLTETPETMAPLTSPPESVRAFGGSLFLVDSSWALQIFAVADGRVSLAERLPLAQPTERISIAGSVAALSGGNSVALADVSTPKRLRELSRIDLGGKVWAHARAGDYLFANVGANLVVMNVSDPARPSVVFRGASGNPLWWNTVIVGDQVLYVGTFEGLLTFDISNPQRPELVATNSLGPVLALHRNGPVLYASALDRPVALLDIAEPRSPKSLENLEFPSIAAATWHGFAQEGSILVVAANYISGSSFATLRFFDVADPARPRFLGWGETVRVLTSMELRLGTLYYASEARLRAYDASAVVPERLQEPQALNLPLITELVDFSRSFMGMALSRGYVLMAEGNAGVSVWAAHLPSKLRGTRQGNGVDFSFQFDPAFVHSLETSNRIDDGWQSMGNILGLDFTYPIPPGESTGFYRLRQAGPAGEVFP